MAGDRAGEGNRTLTASLEGWGSTIELRPRLINADWNARSLSAATVQIRSVSRGRHRFAARLVACQQLSSGGSRIRTCEGRATRFTVWPIWPLWNSPVQLIGLVPSLPECGCQIRQGYRPEAADTSKMADRSLSESPHQTGSDQLAPVSRQSRTHHRQ